ncbi:MAG: PIN domain-containing protein [Candidatus Aenigmarchaeota archaeon]|nr:PIN domain-containing protein [Candidatus Aenigmarchaeota archaeon]
MKPKTIERLIRRLKKLPVIHLDTSIILEPGNTEEGYHCKKLLNVLGIKYRGKLSLVALGELLLDIVGLENYSERQDSVEFVYSLIKRKKIEYGIITKTVDESATRIKQIDPRIEQTDRLIMACAAEDKADYFATLDRKLIGNGKLERELGAKIRHPKDLV